MEKLTNTTSIDIIVTRDGELDDNYYDAIYAARRRAALEAAGKRVVGMATRPFVNLGLNVLDLLRDNLTETKAS